MNKLFTIIEIALSVLKGVGLGGPIPSLADALVKIAQAANAAHVAETGKPIDVSLLTPEDPIK